MRRKGVGLEGSRRRARLASGCKCVYERIMVCGNWCAHVQIAHWRSKRPPLLGFNLVTIVLGLNMSKEKSRSNLSSFKESQHEMKASDSVVNLTKPSLYAIYNDSATSLNQQNEEVEEYIEGNELHIKAKDESLLDRNSIKHMRPPRKMTPFEVLCWVTARLAIVSFAAFVYNEVTKHVHASHLNDIGTQINAYLVSFMDNWQPIYFITRQAHPADRFFSLALEGLILSSILPILDSLMPSTLSKRLLSSSPDPYVRSNLMNDIIRSLIAFLGVSYAIRHIEWESSLQMAIMWSVINPGLWLLLDGTFSGLVASCGTALGGSVIVYLQNGAKFSSSRDIDLTIFLFISSFFFCGVIIFGKLGRLLFGKTKSLQ